MMPLLIKWLLASVGSLLAGLLAWALLSAASRAWPALLSRRAVWLAAYGVVLCVALMPFLLPLMPSDGQIGVPAPVTVRVTQSDAFGEITTVAAAPPAAPAGPTASAASAASAAPATLADSAATISAAGNEFALPPPALMLPAMWLAVYAAGLAFALARLLRARHVWRGLLAAAQPLSPQELQAHGAFNASQLAEIAQRRLTVMETGAAVSPMLVGLRRPLLLLPQHLRGFSAEQQQMIVAHELHHWRQRDPLCLGLAAALQTLFWFNPALRWMGQKLQWALELACDQHVLAGRPQQQRKQYAAALLTQWKAQATSLPAGGVAFGGIDGATAAARIRQMQQTGLPALSRSAAWLVTALLAGVVVAAAMLQPALAFNADSRPVQRLTQSTPPDVPSMPGDIAAWRYPLEKMRVTGFFGVHRDVLPTPHKGIDLAAAKGTPVHAVADGVVIAAGALAENGGRYGNAVIIDHGGRRSLYAHLNSVAVKTGDRVVAGQEIGAVGETGFATGPHLHFEVRQDSQLLDPATMLTGLDAYATKRALRIRRQQLTAGN
jgi:murein DD-endopeptidase MepM/ murein hydrolase activator NlpD